ncbi:two-component system response regulator [Pontibacter silvestris]|uniref:Two-component system response regulator n=1 Tax=Pontibacter silvestris TaxID=2305183 RepID=A0ABW4X2Z7_9BACT|nr:response regulator [Pontibacter silvestris]MCC9135023.1 response regulator [Pontibacter silvestris]
MGSLRRVVLIDDDQINNFVCETIIKNNNFANEVLSFEWAEDAVAFLSKVSQETPENFPDLIFLDINMPGMDGWSFIDEYRKLPEEITNKCCLFMLSSAVDRKDVITAKNMQEVKDFFSKPLSPEILDFIKDEFISE